MSTLKRKLRRNHYEIPFYRRWSKSGKFVKRMAHKAERRVRRDIIRYGSISLSSERQLCKWSSECNWKGW